MRLWRSSINHIKNNRNLDTKYMDKKLCSVMRKRRSHAFLRYYIIQTIIMPHLCRMCGHGRSLTHLYVFTYPLSTHDTKSTHETKHKKKQFSSGASLWPNWITSGVKKNLHQCIILKSLTHKHSHTQKYY